MKTLILSPTILFFVLLLFSSCKKTSTSENKNTMTGIVVHYPSRQPVSGTKVYLKIQGLIIVDYGTSLHWTITNSDTISPTPYYLLDSAITDASGKFSLTIPTTCQGNTCFGVYSAVIIDPTKMMVDPFPNLGHSTDTIFIDNPSYFKLNMQKTSPATLNDTVFESRHYLNTYNTPFYNPVIRKGQIGKTNYTVTDTFSYNVATKVVVEWRHYRNGLIASGIDTVNLIPNSTKTVTINY